MLSLFVNFLHYVRQAWGRTIRRQLVWSFSLASLCIILSSGYLLYSYQRHFLFAQDMQVSIDLVKMLASSAGTKVLSEDIASLDELMEVAEETRDLKSAIVTNLGREILAGTQGHHFAKYLDNSSGSRTLPSLPITQVLQDEPSYIVVAAPILVAKQHIGWILIEMTRDTSIANLRDFVIAELGIVIVLIGITTMVANILARRLTDGLQRIVKVAADAEGGKTFLRTDVNRSDEVGLLARHIYRMLDTINQEKSELQEKEYFLSESQRIAHIGSWRYEFSGKLLWSDETYRIFCVDPRIFSPTVESLISLICLDDKQAMQTWIRACASGNKPAPLEFRINAPDGSVRTLSGYGELQYGVGNEPSHMVGMVLDITERKHAERELRVAAIAFESQEGIMITDANNVIIRVNKAFSKITGYSEVETIGQTPKILSSGRHDSAFYAAMWQSIQQFGTWQGEIWNRRRNGEAYPEQLTITRVSDADGKTTNYVGTMDDITYRKATEDQIRYMAFFDALTKLPNRRLFGDRLSQAMTTSKREGRYGALMFLDLDNFKPLNDRYGHKVGDLLLIEVANRIGACVRESDTVGRFGGDEFVVVLAELDEDQARSKAQANIVAEKIRASLSLTYNLTNRQEGVAEYVVEHQCTSSIGVVMFMGQDVGIDDLFKRADTAMYNAKASGRNLIRFYDELV
ncbi:putative diguanylate cyclase YegE [Ferriphaselus amnicola]|uniref:Putative diguanylate cyclase YegE n=1 Tax=Ferriphaselus amnicola TaxID=1188319 RepID=A0A2Z6GC41_9PROT|nr:diguanylate cyclase [Ferriphaselus amnicola]BBE50970.1 putative diguanylate cyclase YegE [Ferriphaselus amnicola]